MKIGIAQYTSQGIEEEKEVVNELSHSLKIFFKGYQYSKDVEEIYFGFICVVEESKFFFKPKRHRLSKKDNTFQFESDFDMTMIKSCSEKEIILLLIEKFKEVPLLLPKRVTDFKTEEYLHDLDCFTIEYVGRLT
ncbi:hypothetical protein [Saccharicrinis aurantiacus]|uniref:hypothetical protein n=1 Tax=Saccharicrinis aurantiacus TaxID=1849719 RepID=UPI0024933548|nr:hypothetical protein [Saccharicrinis aurantiacus]